MVKSVIGGFQKMGKSKNKYYSFDDDDFYGSDKKKKKIKRKASKFDQASSTSTNDSKIEDIDEYDTDY